MCLMGVPSTYTCESSSSHSLICRIILNAWRKRISQMSLWNAGKQMEVTHDTLLCSIELFTKISPFIWEFQQPSDLCSTVTSILPWGNWDSEKNKLLPWGDELELSFTKQLLCANEVTSTALGFGMSNMTKPCIARSHTVIDFDNTQSSVKIVKWLSNCRGNTAKGFSHRS